MKNFLSNPLAIAVTMIVCLYFFFMRWYLHKADSGPFPLSWSVSVPADDTSFAGIFFNPSVNDSLPHYQYRKIEDSLKLIKTKKELSNRSLATDNRIGFIGAASIDEDHDYDRSKMIEKNPLSVMMMDSINELNSKLVADADSVDLLKNKKLMGELIWRYKVHINKLHDSLNKVGNRSYYLSLSNYVADPETYFFIDKGTYHLAYVVYDSVVKRTYDSVKLGHYERKEINVRFSKEENKVLIPVKKSWFTFLSILVFIFQLGTIAALAMFTVGLPVQILISISKGQAFTPKNLYRLRAIAVFFLVYGVIAVTAPYLVHFIFRQQIPHELNMGAGILAFTNRLIYFFIAAIVFILSVAFKNGYRLQQEQNLII